MLIFVGFIAIAAMVTSIMTRENVVAISDVFRSLWRCLNRLDEREATQALVFGIFLLVLFFVRYQWV